MRNKLKSRIWCVYLMAASDTKGVTYFKVGRTSDLPGRIASVQTGCPLKIAKVWAINLWSNGASQMLEDQMHKHLESNHSHGEWFRFDTDSLDHKRLLNDSMTAATTFASQMQPMKWREISVDALRKAVRELNAEVRAKNQVAEQARVRRAIARLALSSGQRKFIQLY